MAVDLSSKYTKENREFDGLVAIEKELIEEALAGTPGRHVLVMLVEVTAMSVNVKDGTRTPRVTTMATEVLDGDDANDARAALDRQYRRRTGRHEAPQDTLFDGGKPEGNAVYPVAPAQVDGGDPWPGDADYQGDGTPEAGTDDPDGGDPRPARGRKK